MRGDSRSRRFWVGEVWVKVALVATSSTSGGEKGSLVKRKFSAVQTSCSRTKRSAKKPNRRTCPSETVPPPATDTVTDVGAVLFGDLDTSALCKVPISIAPDAFSNSPVTLL